MTYEAFNAATTYRKYYENKKTLFSVLKSAQKDLLILEVFSSLKHLIKGVLNFIQHYFIKSNLRNLCTIEDGFVYRNIFI